LAYLSKLKAWNLSLRPYFMFTTKVVGPAEMEQVVGVLTNDEMASCLQSAGLKGRKQLR
jgi:hypothetical protein